MLLRQVNTNVSQADMRHLMFCGENAGNVPFRTMRHMGWLVFSLTTEGSCFPCQNSPIMMHHHRPGNYLTDGAFKGSF